MMHPTDSELLNAYALRGREAAFAELVRRHVGLVYSAARRMVVDPHLAEDVTQAVFIALARNARELQRRTVLSSWLLVTTRNLAAKTVRNEVRRRAREQEAAIMPSSEPETIWASLAPHLDDALAELNGADRDALMLRFFEHKTAREIGQRLGLAEEAAQKRVERALDRLRGVMASRGLAVSSAALSGALCLPVAQAAPAGLAATLTAKVLAGSAASASVAGGVAKGLNFAAQMKAHPIAAAVAIVACLSLGTTGFVFGKAAARKHHAVTAWQQAILGPEPETPATARATATVDPIADPVPVAEPAPAVSPRLSVAEIIAQAADCFRLHDTDPDAWAKGFVALEKLRPEEIEEALRHAESLRGEPDVFENMMPFLAGMWANIHPRAALEYSIGNLEGNARALAVQRVVGAWAGRNPEEAWAWYRQTNDAGSAPIRDDTWGWLPRHIFEGWVRSDAAGAFKELAGLGLRDERSALSGISDAVMDAGIRPAILEGVARMADDGRRHRMAEELVEEWCNTEPQAATEWAASLVFENPASRLHVVSESLERWWMFDPHGASTWALTHAPEELQTQIRELIEKNR